jgi:hypothetical protein
VLNSPRVRRCRPCAAPSDRARRRAAASRPAACTATHPAPRIAPSAQYRGSRDFGGKYPVSVMPSGPNTRACRYASSD